MFKRVLCMTLAIGCALVFASCSGFLGVGPASPAIVEPPNLTLRKRQVVNYVNSGDYGREIARVALAANKLLSKRGPRLVAEGKKVAVVFDIDDTALTNYSHMLAYDFGYESKTWAAWVAAGRAHAIVPVQTIYDTALRLKLDVFFITGRKESERLDTEKNLRDVGYGSWTGIYFQSNSDRGSTQAFKAGVRRQLVADGYLVLANIGDQASDLDGGNAERTFKLPNPFYLTD